MLGYPPDERAARPVCKHHGVLLSGRNPQKLKAVAGDVAGSGRRKELPPEAPDKAAGRSSKNEDALARLIPYGRKIAAVTLIAVEAEGISKDTRDDDYDHNK